METGREYSECTASIERGGKGERAGGGVLKLVDAEARLTARTRCISLAYRAFRFRLQYYVLRSYRSTCDEIREQAAVRASPT